MNLNTDPDPGKKETDPDPAKKDKVPDNLQKVYAKKLITFVLWVYTTLQSLVYNKLFKLM